MPRPPDCVVFVARTHWIVGASIAVTLFPLHLIAQRLPYFEFGLRTYVITAGVALLYGLAGTLVWLGAPSGRWLSRVCSLLYLPRIQFGSRVWRTMDREDFRAHFSRR
ncbi:MAG: hypothetical protein JNK23_18815 [Opitutaceae bacterium]|nr:hypothetical protein [Opitutaceae bacterium]